MPSAILFVEWLAVRAAARLFRASDAAGDLIHAAAVFLLLSAAAMPIVKSVAALPGLAVMGIGFALGGAATAAYWRLAAVRAVVSILSPIALLSPGWFLFLSPASRFLVRWSPPRALTVRVGNPAPVVIVIFDEFSGISLMDRDRRIDRGRFPNLAALADDGVWFRNATTVSGETESAIPAVLTGNRPAPGVSEPCAAEYPNSLFTLLGKSHRVTAVEPLSSLCPDDLCGRPATQMPWLRRVRSYLIDAAVLECAILLPAEGPLAGPHVAGRFGCFLDQDGDAAWDDFRVRRREAFDAFLAKIRPEKRPALYFAHAVLPHQPWIYLPSGKEYLPMPLPRQLDRNTWVADGAIGWLRATECWTADPWAVAQARQRYLLQIAMVDRLVGRLIRRLKETGLYDRSLIVVTADHGVCFLPGQSLRSVGKATCPEIMPVPLVMKLPGGPRGVVSDRNVESIDILPTIAQALQVELPWKTEGGSALDPSLPERPRKEILVTGGTQPPLRWEAAFPEKDAALQRMLAGMGSGARQFRADQPARRTARPPVERLPHGGRAGWAGRTDRGRRPRAARSVRAASAVSSRGKAAGPFVAAPPGVRGRGRQRRRPRRDANVFHRRPGRLFHRHAAAGRPAARKKRRAVFRRFRPGRCDDPLAAGRGPLGDYLKTTSHRRGRRGTQGIRPSIHVLCVLCGEFRDNF